MRELLDDLMFHIARVRRYQNSDPNIALASTYDIEGLAQCIRTKLDETGTPKDYKPKEQMDLMAFIDG